MDYTFPIPDDTTGAVNTMSFDNTANTYYAMVAFRPSGVGNKVIRNLELAFRYSSYTTPDGAPWATYDSNGKNIVANQTAIALNYWFKWNCVAKVCYQMQTNNPDQVYIQLYYGF